MVELAVGGEQFCLVVEVEGPVVVAVLVADVSTEDNSEAEEPELVEVDCLIHEPVELC